MEMETKEESKLPTKADWRSTQMKGNQHARKHNPPQDDNLTIRCATPDKCKWKIKAATAGLSLNQYAIESMNNG